MKRLLLFLFRLEKMVSEAQQDRGELCPPSLTDEKTKNVQKIQLMVSNVMISPWFVMLIELYRATHCCLETTVIDSSIPVTLIQNEQQFNIDDKWRVKCVFPCFLQEEQLTLQREDNQQLISEVSCFMLILAQLEDF